MGEGERMSEQVRSRPWWKRWWVVALAVLAVLVLAGNLMGEDAPAADPAQSAPGSAPAVEVEAEDAGPDSTEFVCDDFARFIRDGRPDDQRPGVVAGIGDLIGGAHPRVAGAYDTLTNTVDGTPGAQRIADDAFAQACFDAGWDG